MTPNFFEIERPMHASFARSARQSVPLHAVTATELKLLATLASHRGRVLSRGQLIATVYGGDHHISERTIDTHVRNLRSKLAAAGAPVIETVHGVGYRCG